MEINDQILNDILAKPFFRGRILSGSMDPVIKVGDEILVDVKARDFKRFDIIVFAHENILICHYVWRVNKLVQPLMIQTRSLKGELDFPVSMDKYVGKVISHRLGIYRKLRAVFFN
jgi:signal peptidase I